MQGSAEAIQGALAKLGTDEVGRASCNPASAASPNPTSTLAQAVRRGVIGFNVRANAQARERAKRDGVEIRYYNIIYDVVDDVKTALSGMLAPTCARRCSATREILEVFRSPRSARSPAAA